jgi:crotonobetainyl-CoA:carnitine CoA-transferase CaiB-like acyl-CoA transferase
VQLNLKTADGRRLLTKLIRSGDVVIENFSRRAAASLGLTYDELREIREDIILGSISAFGRTGPWGGYIALHSGVFLLSGLASVTRDAAGRPRLPGSALPDTLTGTFLALAIVQALAERARTGRGCCVEISMLDVSLAAMGGLVADADSAEIYAPHPAQFLPTVEPGRFIAVSNGGAQADASLLASVAGKTRRESVETLQAAGIAAAPVQDLLEVMLDPHLHARRFILADDHPVAGARPVPATVWIYDGKRAHVGHAPRLGADTDDVLARVVGLDERDIATLRADGALT